MKLRIWNKTEALYLADGTSCEPEEVMRRWPFSRHFDTLLEMNGPLVAAIDCLPMIADMCGIDTDLPVEEQLSAIQAIREAQRQPAESVPSPEERMAAALEFQNMVALATMNGGAE